MTHPAGPVRNCAAVFGPVLSTWLKTGLGVALIAGIYAWRVDIQGPEETFFWTQDLPVLAIGALILLWLRMAPAAAFDAFRPAARWAPPRTVVALAVVCALIGLAGTLWLFGAYRMSLDEFMADFDAQIFASGHLVARPPAQWRDYVPALQPIYMLPVPGNEVWASSYLPLNAAVRGLALKVGLRDLVNPLWSAISVLAVYGVARRLWPTRPRMALGAAALLASSSQLLIMSMTAYAMSAHLALNLVWLWLFLRGGKLGHGGAAVVAFVASGLHQMLFNPLFAAPFVLQLWLERRWAAAAFHTAAYACIGLFWILYWSALLKVVGVAPAAAASLGGGWFASRVAALLANIQLGAIGPMAESLLRFVTWQNPLTVPLAVMATIAAVRTNGNPRALVLGVVLTVLAMLLLVPSQTHGWGYRYLHGLMGSVCLLAVWGWTRLTDELSAEARAAANAGFAAACAASLLLLTPLRAWQAWSFVRPYAAANALIQSAPTQVVLVDDDTLLFDMGTVVRNDPFLVHGPKVMLLAALTAPQVRALCAHYSVGVFDGRQAVALGVPAAHIKSRGYNPPLRAMMARLKCGAPLS